MSTRYEHTNVGGGNQDEPERKDAGWESRQGGSESRRPGSTGDASARDRAGDDQRPAPSQGTNTQGDLAGIGEAARRVANEVDGDAGPPEDPSAIGIRERDARGAGTDQPVRMGGPLGADPDDPHLPEGAQDTESRGSGAGGFDRGVNAKVVGAVHQGVREEDPEDAR
jgi:hypothetical protein